MRDLWTGEVLDRWIGQDREHQIRGLKTGFSPLTYGSSELDKIENGGPIFADEHGIPGS